MTVLYAIMGIVLVVIGVKTVKIIFKIIGFVIIIFVVLKYLNVF